MVSVGDLVLVHDEGHPRSHWNLGKVERILTSKDGQSRGAEVIVQAKRSKRTSLLGSEEDKCLALKVVVVAYNIKYSDLTWQFLVFWKTGC